MRTATVRNTFNISTGRCDGPIAVVPLGAGLEVVSGVERQLERARFQDPVIRG
ncbi:MAG TPA: hypothetical protein VM470_07045 [Acidimicrobiia bacterium]|nr:hypothetical protein [Acidimicrobiia bacterium]